MRFICSEHHQGKPTSDSGLDHETTLDLRAEGLVRVWKHVKSLVTNGPYMFSMLAGTFDGIVVNGFVAFGAKYFQQQFYLTASMSGVVFGQSFHMSCFFSNALMC